MKDFQRDLEVMINEGIFTNRNIRFVVKHFERMKGDIRSLDLSDRAMNRLLQNRITTMEQLYNRFNDIAHLRQVGIKIVKEVKTGYISYYYDTLNKAEREEFWRDTVKATEEMNSKAKAV